MRVCMHVRLYIWVYGCTHACTDSFRLMLLHSCCSCTSWVCNCFVVKFLMNTQCPGGTLPNLPWHLGQWILCEVILLLMENASTGWGGAQVPHPPLLSTCCQTSPHWFPCWLHLSPHPASPALHRVPYLMTCVSPAHKDSMKHFFLIW